MILIGPKTNIITRSITGYSDVCDLKHSTISDGINWITGAVSKIASYEMDCFKVTFSDGLSILTSDDQKFVMKSGKIRPTKRLHRNFTLSLGRFHLKEYYNPEYIDTDHSKLNQVAIQSVEFHGRGILYTIDGLGFNQNLCLSNGVLLQN